MAIFFPPRRVPRLAELPDSRGSSYSRYTRVSAASGAEQTDLTTTGSKERESIERRRNDAFRSRGKRSAVGEGLFGDTTEY